ncbi:head completion/stabilization protein [Pseudomonas knackmussii]|uniref:head completion/stabilization protein n=1 Tax=Pseudomonas knackmussii TaxID=65741 RepID=UPI003F4A3183
MSAFVAGGELPGGTINSDPFWPGIDLDAVRAAMRIGADISPAKLEVAVISAIIDCNRALRAWQADQQGQGITELSQVPAPQIKGESELVHLYRRAVRCALCAELAERYRWYDTTNSGSQNADERTPSIDEYRRDQRWALNDLQGRPRSTVALV